MEKDIKIGTWNTRSLYRLVSLRIAARELSRYKLELVCVKVKWNKGGTLRAGDFNFFFMEK